MVIGVVSDIVDTVIYLRGIENDVGVGSWIERQRFEIKQYQNKKRTTVLY